MRYASIDILRTVAIVVMVFVHFGENLSGYISPFAGFGAPLFAFLSGVSYYLWSSAQESRGKETSEISRISVRRSLFVFGVGLLFNVLVWLPGDVFNWDVLTFIGATLLLLNLVRELPLSVLVTMAIASVVISPVLRDTVDYSSYWINRYFDPDMTLADTVIGFLVAGYFPIFPWIAFPLAGFVTASMLFAEPLESSAPQPSPWPFVVLGAALVLTSMLLLSLQASLSTAVLLKLLGGWTMFPPTIEYVTGTLGIALILLGSLHHFVDRSPCLARYDSALSVPRSFSQYSFTIYIVHHIVHLWPLWLYSVVHGQEPTYYWMKAMPLSISIPLALAFLMTTFVVLRCIGQERQFGVEACMRWVCD